VAWVQGPTPSSGGSATTNAKAFTGSTPAGNLVVVQITQLFGGSAPQSITHVRDNIDGAVNYTLAKSQTIGGGPDARVDTYYRVVTSTGTRTVTVTFAGACDSSIGINEYDATHTVLDVTNGNTGTTGNITPGSVTPPGTALYVVACVNANGVTITPDGAWDQRQEVESSGICTINTHDKITSGAQNPTTTTGSTPGAWVATIATFIAGSSIEQEGFRFRNDDGSETTATAAGAQDANVTAPLSANLRLRALLNATGDPASQAFTLYYKKSGEGSYAAVPMGATYPTVTPTYVGGQVAGRAGNVATASVNFALTGGLAAVPAAGDLVIITVVVGSQGRTPACAVSGYTALGQINANGTTYDTSMDVSWKVMGGTPDTSFTLPATGNAQDAQRYTIQVWRGVDATTPMDVTPVTASGTGTGRPNPGTITPTTAEAIILICAGGAAAAGAAYTGPANYTTNFLTGATADTNDAMVGSGYRATAWTSGAEDPAVYTGGTTNAADSWAAYTLALRPAVVAGNNRIYVATSANITAGGEATTAQLTAPTGKSTSDFTTGRMWDNENGSDSIDIAADFYTELEWCLQAQSPAVDGDVYQFRVYSGSNPLDAYTVTPEWTIGTAGGITEAEGSAAGAATVSGVGAAIAGATGASSGTGTAAGAGAAVLGGTGAASGAATVTGAAQAVAAGAGSAAGAGTASGTGAALAGATGTAAGAGTVSGTSGKIAGVEASAAGVAAAAGAAAITAEATGSAAGLASIAGGGAGVGGATGSSSAGAGGSGAAAAIAGATGSSAGTATVAGDGEDAGGGTGGVVEGTGSSAGTAAVTGVGAAIAGSTGAAAGAGTVSGVSGAIAQAAGSSSGASIATGDGAALKTSTGDSVGSGSVAGAGAAVAQAAGSAAGAATVAGDGQAVQPEEGQGTGTSAGSAEVVGIGETVRHAPAGGAFIARTGAAGARQNAQLGGRRVDGASPRITSNPPRPRAAAGRRR
jgi:hypothetical protein